MSLFTAKVEPQPMHFNSIPKFRRTMWQYVLIPIEPLPGSAEDASVLKGDNVDAQLGGFWDLLRLCIFASEWRQNKNRDTAVEICFDRFGSPRPLRFVSLFQAIWNAHRMVGRKHGDRDPLGDRFLDMHELVLSPCCCSSRATDKRCSVTSISKSIVLQKHTF